MPDGFSICFLLTHFTDPCVDSINTTTIFRFLNSSKWPASSEGHDVRYALTFCLVIKLLNKDERFLDWSNYPWDAHIRPRTTVYGRDWHRYHDIMMRELRHSKHANSFGVSLSDDQDDDEVTTETRHRLLTALALLSRDFRVTYLEHSITSLYSRLSPRKIPFTSMM